MTSLDLSLYKPGDTRFARPYIEIDEQRAVPLPHRHVHGGFEGTDTRFRFYFPPQDSGYEGRMFNPLMGASGGSDDFFGGMYGDFMGGLAMCFRLGGYMVESNQGHIGNNIDHQLGNDPGVYGWVATTEVARLSKHIAAQVYGAPPHHSYVFGGSAGGHRSPLCLENAPDVWDAALPFMGGGDIGEPGNNDLASATLVFSFSTLLNVQRLLGAKVNDVVDAMAPGGSGDPYAGLTTHQREELACLYRQGFPRGVENMIAEPWGQIWAWAAIADTLVEHDPGYFEAFWTQPGYIGHDHPELVAHDVINQSLPVKRVLTFQDVMSDPEFQGEEYAALHRSAILTLTTSDSEGVTQLPVAVEVPGLSSGYRLGCGVRVATGKAAGRQLYATAAVGDFFFCDSEGEPSVKRFTDVVPGDEVHLDNRSFLAFCYFIRHHTMPDRQYDSLRVDGKPVYRQHPIPLMPAVLGNSYCGRFAGKLMWVHHTHDSEVWPPQGVLYADAVRKELGEAGAAEQFRIRWTEHAEHVPPMMTGESLGRAATTCLIDYLPVIEQSLADLADWVENGVDPAPTAYEYRDGRVILPKTAKERGGIQPVVRATANGAVVAEVAVGQPVELEVHAEVPPGAGTIVDVEWDFDGSGEFPVRHEEIDGAVTEITLKTTHSYSERGTYFPTALVHSHRDGDPEAEFCRIPNLAQVRVIVT